MLNPLQAKQALKLLSDQAIRDAIAILSQISGAPASQRAALMDALEQLIGVYADGSSTLAADLYYEMRNRQGVGGNFLVDLVVADRAEKIRRALAYASEPLITGEGSTVQRLSGVVQAEVSRPFRETIVANANRDRKAVGWQRITGVCCPFCAMLASRGAVYKESTAYFGAHEHCDCTAAPVFIGGDIGPEASVMQYMASRRHKTRAQKDALNAYLAEFFPE